MLIIRWVFLGQKTKATVTRKLSGVFVRFPVRRFNWGFWLVLQAG
jgi:hypothetical protein